MASRDVSIKRPANPTLDIVPGTTPKLREATFEDYPGIAQLQAAYQRPIANYDQWKHLWVNNPAYIQTRNTLPIGWVLERADKKIVGYLGNIPLFYELDGRKILTLVAHAWVVDVAYRTFSLALLDVYFSQKSVELFLNATVGAPGFNSFAVFQSVPTPVGEWDRSVFWITNYQGFLADWLGMKKVPLAKALSYPLAAIPAIKQLIVPELSSYRSSSKAFRVRTKIDDDFDVFWQTLRNRNRNILLGVRSTEVLEWHFGPALRNQDAWIVSSDDSSGMMAYGIFLRYDNPGYGLKRVRFVDYQALDGSTTHLLPMLSWALDKCRKEGVHMLEVLGFAPEKRNLITKVAPYKRKLPCWLYFYKARDKKLAERLKEPDVWQPSQFDGDASL